MALLREKARQRRLANEMELWAKPYGSFSWLGERPGISWLAVMSSEEVTGVFSGLARDVITAHAFGHLFRGPAIRALSGPLADDAFDLGDVIGGSGPRPQREDCHRPEQYLIEGHGRQHSVDAFATVAFNALHERLDQRPVYRVGGGCLRCREIVTASLLAHTVLGSFGGD